jgi:hypothetical protein
MQFPKGIPEGKSKIRVLVLLEQIDSIHIMNDAPIKYPRTFHLPWSESMAADDKRLSSTSCFEGKSIVVTEKMDGENTSLYRNYFHARSIDGRDHPSRSWVKSLHARLIKHDIPQGWRICGENLYAQHSIRYDNLKSYFYVFSIWDDKNVCLSWDETEFWCELLELEHVPVIARLASYDEAMIKSISLDQSKCEGYVIRNASSFTYEDFSSNVAKFVRQNHVQTEAHWMHSNIIPNGLLK